MWQNKLNTGGHTNCTYLKVVWVQVSLVLVCGLVASMAVFDDWVQKIFKHLICLLITSNTAHSHDEWMA